MPLTEAELKELSDRLEPITERIKKEGLDKTEFAHETLLRALLRGCATPDQQALAMKMVITSSPIMAPLMSLSKESFEMAKQLIQQLAAGDAMKIPGGSVDQWLDMMGPKSPQTMD